MHTIPAVMSISAALVYFLLHLLLHFTQNECEPPILESRIPFLDAALGILKYRAGYLAKFRQVC